ncbi:MAG: hypothetical protein JO077_18200 [Verrucomicrobia bacterium]|nr:hypothetical protein [Verrucomicrobiota bacterium]
MKTLLIALFASVSLFLAGCGKEPARTVSESSTPSPSPEAIGSGSNTSETSSETAVTSETAPTASPRAPAKLTFKTEAATQAATAYLNAYSTLINDINARTIPRGTDAETAISKARAQLETISRDSAEVTKQQNRVQQVLTPEEIQRLLQYRKTVDPTSTNEL